MEVGEDEPTVTPTTPARARITNAARTVSNRLMEATNLPLSVRAATLTFVKLPRLLLQHYHGSELTLRSSTRACVQYLARSLKLIDLTLKLRC
jgi:hypothetical protein